MIELKQIQKNVMKQENLTCIGQIGRMSRTGAICDRKRVIGKLTGEDKMMSRLCKEVRYLFIKPLLLRIP